jgi:pimeloyl-ACP methyl ester carboxylesterase
MATYVLVPGAWLGAWAWGRVAQRLRERGHDVHPVTLPGLADRAADAGPEVDLETHIGDVVGLLDDRNLADVVLVGHSYGALVTTGVADRAPDRLARLVYVDSAPIPDGMAMVDLFPPEAYQALQRTVAEHGDGWALPFPSFEELERDASLTGLGPEERRFMAANATRQPFGTYTQPLRLRGEGGGSYGKVAIACEEMQQLVASGEPSVQQITGPDWTYLELATGHWPMLSAPDELADLLDSIAPGPRG